MAINLDNMEILYNIGIYTFLAVLDIFLNKKLTFPFFIFSPHFQTIVGLIPEKNPNLHEKRGDKFQTQNL